MDFKSKLKNIFEYAGDYVGEKTEESKKKIREKQKARNRQKREKRKQRENNKNKDPTKVEVIAAKFNQFSGVFLFVLLLIIVAAGSTLSVVKCKVGYRIVQ